MHNEIRDVMADLLEKAGCRDVVTEHHLMEVGKREPGSDRGQILADGARMDITCLGLWGRMQRAYLDVRVTNPAAPSNLNLTIEQLKERNENEKKRAYGERVREVERGSFSPLVFTTGGGCGKECAEVLQKIANLIERRTGEERAQAARRTGVVHG